MQRINKTLVAVKKFSIHILFTISFSFLAAFVFAENAVDHDLVSSEFEEIHEEAEEMHEVIAHDEEEFDAITMIMEHVKDANEWHIMTIGDAEHGKHISLPLPIIVWDGSLKVFLSSAVAHGHEHEGYTLSHSQLVSTEGKEKATVMNLSQDNLFFDFSITKNVAGIIVSAILMLIIFVGMAKSYKKNGGVPRGIAAFLEPIVEFVKNDIAIPNIGKDKYMKFLPYLLTLFFFIWVNNLLGLVPVLPGGANVTGNIAVTLVLAVFTFVLVAINGNKAYWGHILNPPVPMVLKVIMIPIEIIGIVTKPFALMMRLFANITAGHIMILSLVALIFIFKTSWLGLASVPLALFISVLELLVAALQAYIFTVLTALFIGMAVVEHDHH